MKYQIVGEPMPVVICQLESGETVVTEGGSMCWMSPHMEMQTSGGGGLGKAFGRMLSGEAIFQNLYTAKKAGEIAFASSFPGAIRALEITPSHPVVVQKGSFLASERGVDLSVFFQKKVGAGLFGGDGFIMQKLAGNGLAFIEIDGSAVEYVLGAGEQMIVDTGNLAMMDASCSIDIVAVKGVKNMLFGGEGVFNTVVTGPGKIILQTMPVSGFANSLSPYFASKGSK